MAERLLGLALTLSQTAEYLFAILLAGFLVVSHTQLQSFIYVVRYF